MNSMKRIGYGAILLGLLCLTACNAENESAPLTGTMQMQLTQTMNGTRYELLYANFTVEGNGESLFVNGDNQDILQLDLDPGDYAITLEDGWEIVRETNPGVAETVPAVLTSDNPVNFTIVQNSETPVGFSFTAGDNVIPFGQGRLTVSIDITEDNTDTDNGGACVVGNTTGDQVAVLGDSFIGMGGMIQEIESLAIAAGSLQPADNYINAAVSGSTMSQIANEYEQVQNANDIRFVVMTGGAMDCMAGNLNTAQLNIEMLLLQMADDGVEKMVYVFYPDPLGPFAGSVYNACIDELRPFVESFCEGGIVPECHFVDLRETWDGHPEYTSDGLHPTPEGDIASAAAIWATMEEYCVAQ
jgi:hypothetical protein